MCVYQIEGKIALITGGAGAIGIAIATELLEKGLNGVSLVDLKPSPEIDKLAQKFGSHKIFFVATDVSNQEQLENAFEVTVKKFKHLDIVINNAGIMNETNWELTIAINLGGVIRSTYLAMQTYLPRYKSRGSTEGVVVNTSSLSAIDGLNLFPVYNSTKSAILSLGRSLGTSDYYKNYQVRVLTLLPGNTASAFNNISPEVVPMVKPEFGFDLGAAKEAAGESQTPDFVGRGVVEMIEVGANGSMWVVQNQKGAYQIALPSRKELTIV